MISFSNDNSLTIKFDPTVTVMGTIRCGGIDLPYETKYDFSNIPGKWHYLFIQIIQKNGVAV